MKEEFIYKRINECDLRAVLFPTTEFNKPLIIYIHGGGLIWGSPEDLIKEQIKLYNEAGYNVLSLAYRLAPETKIPEIVDDIRDALQWVYEEGIKEFNFNSDKVAVIGSSAGGYLALHTGTFKFRPNAIVSFYGYGDITGNWYKEPSKHFSIFPSIKKPFVDLLINEKEVAEAPILTRYAIYLYCRQQGEWLDYTIDMNEGSIEQDLESYSPIFLIDDTYPPTLQLHGDKDEEVPYDVPLRMKASLNDNHIKNKLITIKGGRHSFDKHMHDQQVKDAFDEVLHFLDETL